MADNPARDKLVNAYHSLLKEMKNLWHENQPKMKDNLDEAMEKVAELEEITREELETTASYLKRDLEQAADFLEKSEKSVADWLKFDLEFAEQKFAEMFAEAVDKTRIELAEFNEKIHEEAEWHTGEITGPGILFCQKCGEELQFKKPGHIPPCPSCHHTVFKKHYKAG
jgi:DNA polymerase III alpha subunit (gram-positive type)